MLKRVGVLALMLSASAAFLQPTAAFAQERFGRGGYHYSGERRDGSRRDWDRREDRREWREHEWREHERWENQYRRSYSYNYYYAPQPNYYYAPNPYYTTPNYYPYPY